MAVPTYDQFIEPVLLYLAQHPDGVPARQVYEAAADALGLDEEDKQLLLASAPIPVYKNRAAWAHDRLKRAGLSSSPSAACGSSHRRASALRPTTRRHSRSSRCSGS